MSNNIEVKKTDSTMQVILGGDKAELLDDETIRTVLERFEFEQCDDLTATLIEIELQKEYTDFYVSVGLAKEKARIIVGIEATSFANQ